MSEDGFPDPSRDAFDTAMVSKNPEAAEMGEEPA
jgi:hypothetical protein